MVFIDIKSPKWTNEEHTAIDCEVIFENSPNEWLPFTAQKEGDTAYGSEIFARCKSGEFGEISPFVPYVPTEAETAEIVRSTRDQLLKDSDWTQLPDVPQSLKDAWAIYRQALRDITVQEGFPSNIVWPTTPV